MPVLYLLLSLLLSPAHAQSHITEFDLSILLTPTPSIAPTLTPTPTPTPLPTIPPLPSTSTDFERAKSDYEFQLHRYRTSLTEYHLAKDRYLQFQTLTTMQDALVKTQALIKSRDLATKAYLSFLNQKVQDTPTISPLQKSRLQNRIEIEIAFLNNHLPQIESFATLKDAFTSARKFDERYSQIEAIGCEILLTVTTTQETALYNQVQTQLYYIQGLLARIRPLQNINKEERWAMEAENRLLRQQEKLSLANRNLQNFVNLPGCNQNTLAGISFTLEESNQYLKETIFYLLETLKEIKRD